MNEITVVTGPSRQGPPHGMTMRGLARGPQRNVATKQQTHDLTDRRTLSPGAQPAATHNPTLTHSSLSYRRGSHTRSPIAGQTGISAGAHFRPCRVRMHIGHSLTIDALFQPHISLSVRMQIRESPLSRCWAEPHAPCDAMRRGVSDVLASGRAPAREACPASGRQQPECMERGEQ